MGENLNKDASWMRELKSGVEKAVEDGSGKKKEREQ